MSKLEEIYKLLEEKRDVADAEHLKATELWQEGYWWGVGYGYQNAMNILWREIQKEKKND